MKKKNNKKQKKEVKRKVPKRVSSGIKGFDALIESGFEEKSTNLIVGTSGSGKTIFATQFLMGGIEKGETVLYITFEEKKEEFYSNMCEFGWDLEKYAKEGKFIFLEYNPEKVRSMLDEGGGAIESIVLKNKVTRIVLDSATSFALLFEDELKRREQALALFDMIRKWECTSLLTLQEDPLDRKEGPSSSLEFEADSIILMYFVMTKNKRERYLEVLKMRGTNHSTELHEVKITNNGIEIGKKSSIDSSTFKN
jgi:circadian clock protein KaiC